jgi:hypothetical protein
MGFELEIPGQGSGSASGVVPVDHNSLQSKEGGGTGHYYHSNQPINTSNSPTFSYINVSGVRDSFASSVIGIADPLNTQFTTENKTIVGAVNELILRQNRIRSTGLITGGEISLNADDDTKIDIAAGVGTLVNSHTDPLNPTRVDFSWSDIIGVTDPKIATDTSTYIAIDSTGTLHFWGDEAYSDEDRRDYVVLGWTSHTDHLVVDTAYSEPQWCLNVYEQLGDFLDNFGAFNIYGNDFIAYSALRISRTEGKTFDNSTNYANVDGKKSPNVIYSDTENDCPIYYFYRSAPNVWENGSPAVSVINPNQYDTGVGLASVPTGYWTIQVITYYAPTNAVDIQFGQTVYSSYSSARSGLGDVVEINPYNNADTFRAWLIIKQGAVDLADIDDAVFVPAGRLGLMSNAVGGGSGGEVNTASNVGISPTSQGLFESKQGVELQFKNIDSGSSKIVITANATNHTVEVDVDSYLKSINQNLGSSESPNFAGLTLSGMSGIVRATIGVLSGGTVNGNEIVLNTRTITSNDSITTSDYLLLVNGTYSLDLPSAVGLQGRVFMIKNINGITTLNTVLGQTIDGDTSITIKLWNCYNIG